MSRKVTLLILVKSVRQERLGRVRDYLSIVVFVLPMGMELLM